MWLNLNGLLDGVRTCEATVNGAATRADRVARTIEGSVFGKTQCVWNYISSPPANCEKASGAASSKRVSRLRKTNLTLSVGPLRCLAMRISAISRSAGEALRLKKLGR